MKTISKVLSILAISTLIVGCNTKKKDSSSSEEQPQVVDVDAAVASFLDGTNITLPSLNS